MSEHNLAFLNQNWFIVHECITELGIVAQEGNECNLVALIEDECDRDVMLQNAALIVCAPDMFKLLVRAMQALDDEILKHDIQKILDFIIQHNFD